MERVSSMRELVELICGKKDTIPDKLVVHSSIPSSLLSEDFPKKLDVVLGMSKRIVIQRWPGFFNDQCRSMLSSHGKYVLGVMTVCLCEHECNRNVFDSFISMCALVTHLSEETLAKAGVNFNDMNPYIIMVLYRNVLKGSFLGTCDISAFVEYICCHKYLKWNRGRNGVDLSNDTSVFLELNEKTKELNRYHLMYDELKSAREVLAKSMVQEVLSNTSFELPSLPSESDLIMRLVASRKKEMAEKTERKKVEVTLANATSHGFSNSDSKTVTFPEEQKNIARHESIIQAVIRHNHSKNSGQKNANNKIQEEAGGLLQHLKNTIKSLVEVLDECNQK